MFIATTAAEGERASCLVGFVTQASIDPARLIACLSKANFTYRVAQLASGRRTSAPVSSASSRCGTWHRDIRRNVPIVEWTEVGELVKSGGLASIGTASADGRPHVAVVSTAVEGDVIWFGSFASSRKVRNLRENPHIALMWRPQAEIYVRGTSQLITSPDDKRRLWDANLFPFDLSGFFGAPDNPELVFVRVEPVSAIVMAVGPDGLARQAWRRV